MSSTEELPVFYQLKMIAKGTKPPVWRRGVVPGNITFAQLALILETMLEYPLSDLYEFDFYVRKERFYEMDSGFRRQTFEYSAFNAPDTYINDRIEHAKRFTFRMLRDGEKDTSLPEFQVDIEKTFPGGAVQNGKKAVDAKTPLLFTEKLPENLPQWKKTVEELNAVLERDFVLHCQSGPVYTGLKDLSAQVEQKKTGLVWSSSPVSDTSREATSMMGTLQDMADIVNGLAGENPEDRNLLIAALNPEAVEKLSDEEKERVADMLHNRSSRINDLLLKHTNTAIPEDVKAVADEPLESLLADSPLEFLGNIEENRGLPSKGRSVEKNAHAIAEDVLDEDRMADMMLELSPHMLDGFEEMIPKGFISPLEGDWDVCAHLLGYGYMATYHGYMIVPHDVAEVYKKLLASGYRKTHDALYYLVLCEKCFSRILVLAPLETLYEMYRGFDPDTDMDTFRELLKKIPPEFQWLRTTDREAMAVWAINENFLETVRSEQRKRDVPYYVPNKEEIINYAMHDYPSWDPYYQDMERFYRQDMKFSKDETGDLLIAQFDCISTGGQLKDLLQRPEARNVVFSSPQQVSRFMTVYFDAQNHTRECVLRGHSPEEMAKFPKYSDDKLELGVEQIPLRISYDPDKAERPDYGRYSVDNLSDYFGMQENRRRRSATKKKRRPRKKKK